MKTAIILHGMPNEKEYFNPTGDSPSNCHWLPWIQKQLLLKGILAQTLEMPHPYKPTYQAWEAFLEQFHIDQNTILIGHSYGGGFLIRWLSEHKVKVGQVLLIAPWIDPYNDEEYDSGGSFDFEIDGSLVDRTDGLTVFISEDDDKAELKTVEILGEKIKGITIRRFKDKGHFTYGDMGTNEFPELLQEIK